MNPHLLYAAVLVLATQLAFSSAMVRVFSMRAFGLKGDVAPNKPDPYLKVWCGSSFGGMTEFIKDTSDPSWSAEFYFPNCKTNDVLKLEVWDKDLNYDDHLGTCSKPVVSGFYYNECSLKYGTLMYNFEFQVSASEVEIS